MVFRPVHSAEGSGTVRTAALVARTEAAREFGVVVEDSVAGVSAARAARMKCVRFAPVRWFGELAEAGANDLITELPEDATACFSGLLNATDQETAAGARV